ncbi:MAG: glycosyltransferase, partial [Flavobacteriaceae bacterium]|nr:glycosyltransferase [Flavobacteriaceae bacterium]
KRGNMTIFNFMKSGQLEKTINSSHIILSRSGYTTIMDLAKLEKKAFFIPTPGQYEQEYLANRLEKLRLVPYCNQDEFKIEMLDKVQSYYGLNALNYDLDHKNLFRLFQSERKLTANS